MANYCAECALYDLNGTPKWGDEHYCSKKGKYLKPTTTACSSFEKNNIKEGYQRAGCYITTIVCNILGYPDDCELLVVLRNFRENYLKQNSEHLPLLIEYDQIGPIISNNIMNDPDAKISAIENTRNFLIPCVQAIKNGNYTEAIEIYKSMVLLLKLKYGLLRTPVDYTIEEPMEALGKGRIRTALIN